MAIRVVVCLLICCLSCCLVVGKPTSKSGHLEIPDGRLYYEECGQGATLVLVHGAFLDSSMWDDQFSVFSSRFRVIRYDARGHGRSSDLGAEVRHHEDLKALLDGLGIEKAAIVGLSLGGKTALDFAIAYPDRVTAVLAVSPLLSGYALDSREMQENQRMVGEALAKGDRSMALEYLFRTWVDGPKRQPSEMDPGVRGKVRRMAEPNWARTKPESKWIDLDPPALNRLSEIKCPVLAVLGDLDMPDVRSIVDLVGRNVPNSRKLVIQGVGHMLSMERPDEFNIAALRFLADELEAAPPAN